MRSARTSRGEVLAALKGSRAVRTGFLRDLSDAELFIPNIGHDRISDLTTEPHPAPTDRIHPTAMRLSRYSTHRHSRLRPDLGSRAAGVDRRARRAAGGRRREDFAGAEDGSPLEHAPDAGDYYNNFVLNFLQAQELAHPALGLVKTLQNGRRVVTKKSLKERFPGTKDFLLQFSEANPGVLEDYKRLKAQEEPAAAWDAPDVFDERAFAGILSRRLEAIPAGADAATQYHRFMKGALEFLFYPGLSHPRIEAEINEGRKRIDIIFLNSDRAGFFNRFPQCHAASRPGNHRGVQELFARFGQSGSRSDCWPICRPPRWLGLLICRRNEAPEQILARCRDTARERRGYILPLDDAAIIGMLRLIETGHRDQVTGHLDLLLRELAL